ncbi:zinc ABC transporter ATP-binding protein ZnuC [Skermanella stibiiresistens]|uniref:zinc ABC transporter ATP-binding protein ZnuC n=1 Tax=Skermanella stibiiresistens TaxID=913326 RepID=UPI0004BCCA8D|nr:zinc ABC transporter ATP-binding protein ZnuC [Skermanella stibiiresistens]
MSSIQEHPAQPPLVTVRGLSVSFGGRTVLEDIDLTVGAGEIVTLIGPNGAGKTTLVKSVLGLVKPSAGSIRLRPGLTVGYMPQRLQVERTLPLTVRRFLTLWRKVGRAELSQVLDEVGAAHVIDDAVQTLSGGELQRVLLARALLRRPDILVLDEPVQAVDVHGQIELFNLIAEIRRTRGCGVLLVSHDLHLVMARTDTVVCVNRHICCSGHPEDVSRHPEYLAMFGRHAEALAVYQHSHDHHHDCGGAVVTLPSAPQPLPDAQAREHPARHHHHG